MPSTDHAKLERRPLYAVLFATAEDVSRPYSPIATGQQRLGSELTVPHGLDREMAAALPGLWYCLHLPNTLFELINISARVIKASQALHLDHRILLAPINAFDRTNIGDWPTLVTPALVVCPDDLVEEATRRSAALGFPFSPVPYSELSNESLRAHWRAIHAQFVPGVPYLGYEPKLASRLDVQPTDLPGRWLARQMGGDRNLRFVAQGDLSRLMDEALWQQAVLAATARLEGEGVTPEVAKERFSRVLAEEATRLRVPVALALPGLPSAYSRRAYERSLHDRIQPLPAVDATDTWSVRMHERSDPLIERAAIEFVTTHRAIARAGVGLMLPSVPQQAFTVLAQLEKHFRGTPRGPRVWRMLSQFDAAAKTVWSDVLTAAIARASMLTVFSNFPLGLLRLPGDTAPISCRVPIAYLPLLPLTRTVQFELSDVPGIDFTTGFRVLIAECIPARDPVGRLSRAGWESAAGVVRHSEQTVTLDYVETLSVDVLRAAIADRRPDFLILSAHGALDERRNTAGILVGDQLCLGPELGQLPPVVILSACHVAPRGAGAVSITDMLLRQGAVAVLGTQVPVDVSHNAMLMVRFFVYITEVLAEREEHSSLLEIWHRVQTSNAINDILNGSQSLREWGYASNRTGPPVIQEFMDVRSRSGIRLGHVYDDTERVLGTIADEEGNGSRIRNLLRSPGYVPESLFYVFAGRPERILLQPPVAMPKEAWEEMRRRGGGRPEESTNQ